jgi:hypothetical protein
LEIAEQGNPLLAFVGLYSLKSSLAHRPSRPTMSVIHSEKVMSGSRK